MFGFSPPQVDLTPRSKTTKGHKMKNHDYQYDLVLLGATGHTGRLCVDYISNYLPPHLNWAIAGRDGEKLAGVLEHLKLRNLNRRSPAIETVDLESSQLNALARKTYLIITTIGPYMKYGEPIIKACALNGTHYLDCTGETPWVRQMINRYHDIARENNATMITHCGIESVPADTLTLALSSCIRQAFNAPTASATVSIHSIQHKTTPGTLATFLSFFEHYTLPELISSSKPSSLTPNTPQQPATPSSRAGIHKIPSLGILTPCIQGTIDTALVYRSREILKESESEKASFSPTFSFHEYMRHESFLSAILFRLTWIVSFLFLSLAPCRRIANAYLSLRKTKRGAERTPEPGASQTEHAEYRAIGVADTVSRERVLGVLRWDGSPYQLTALTLCEAAVVLLQAQGGERTVQAGIVTPACLGEGYIERLRGKGVEIDVRVL